VAANGYPYYGNEALLRLQQILLYRELGMPLAGISAILGRPDFDPLPALEEHRRALIRQEERLRRLIETVDQTIQVLKGRQSMEPADLFKGFSEAEEAAYEQQAMHTYDPEIVTASTRRWRSYSPQEKQRIGEEGNAVYRDMIAVMDQDPAAEAVQAIVDRWHTHMQYFWAPSDEQLLALAQVYGSNPEFRKRFEATKPGLAAYMGKAVAVYVDRRKQPGP
jgi:DNA-binding transcriptional MerR regulator